MGKRNRERRAAKQKHRRPHTGGHKSRQPEPGPDRVQLLERFVIALGSAAMFAGPWKAAELLHQSRGYSHELDVAAEVAVQEAIGAAWEGGWTPTDLHEIARRRVDAAAVRYLDEAIVRQSRRYSEATLHPRWRAQLSGLSGAARPSMAEPQMRRWASMHSLDERTVLTTVLHVLSLLGRIPAIPRSLPLPGTHRQLSVVADDVDQKMLARVRALLAKAEATDYPDEAEALSAKAQALMARHSLQEAVVHHDRGRAPVAASRRIWIDNPYVAAKVSLVQSVASANRCRVVWMKHLGCVVAVGMETDLDLVEILGTSLLVQASRAMLVAGRRHEVKGQARTKSFRLAFLVAYASRIGERLDATSASVTEELRRDDRLLPVLAARSRAADEAFARLFPRTVASPLMAYDVLGTDAGRVAADAALLDVRNSIAG